MNEPELKSLAADKESLHGNKRRAARGAAAAAAYIDAYGVYDLDSTFQDLIADLGHLADLMGVDFDQALSWGQSHLEFERGEDDDA